MVQKVGLLKCLFNSKPILSNKAISVSIEVRFHLEVSVSAIDPCSKQEAHLLILERHNCRQGNGENKGLHTGSK